jgi:hypothetical protein
MHVALFSGQVTRQGTFIHEFTFWPVSGSQKKYQNIYLLFTDLQKT